MLKILEAKCLLYRALLEKEVEFLSDNDIDLMYLLEKDSEVQIILNKFKKK